jgi:hypothetical protein
MGADFFYHMIIGSRAMCFFIIEIKNAIPQEVSYTVPTGNTQFIQFRLSKYDNSIKEVSKKRPAALHTTFVK